MLHKCVLKFKVNQSSLDTARKLVTMKFLTRILDECVIKAEKMFFSYIADV